MSSIVWYELMTTDPGAAAAFYATVLGWRERDSGQAGMDYRLFRAAEVDVAGLMAIPAPAAAAGMPPGWFIYISVPDVEIAVAEFAAAGGRVHAPPMSIPGVGRIAMVSDPDGAVLSLIAPLGSGPARSFSPGMPGHGGWHELHARDSGSALRFYLRQFGWSSTGEVELGAHGVYRLFGFGDGESAGGMFSDASAKRPYWLIVFNVVGIAAALERAAAAGGRTVVPAHQVPTGEWVAHLRDPQGALFAIVSRNR